MSPPIEIPSVDEQLLHARASQPEGDGAVTQAMVELQAELEDKYDNDDDVKELPKGPVSAPKLLQAAAADAGNGIVSNSQREHVQELLQQAGNRGQASFQLEHLLQKATQYTNFIVSNIQAHEERDHGLETQEEPEVASNASKKRKRSRQNGSKKKSRKSKDVRGDISTKGESVAAGRRSNWYIEQPKNMSNGTLKEYQLEGLRWLVTLWQNGMSGILADEMGLGKTIQIIALLAHMREKNVKGNFLITAPLATLPNWISEMKKWVPSIPVVLYHGTREEREQIRRSRMSLSKSNSMDFPVVVTSYEIAVIDRAQLIKYPWKYLIVDEGQRIKNMNCRLIRELKKLNTENRLLLSGTPIQNSLEELWSLLNFVNPMIFDDLSVFQSWFGFRNIGRKKSAVATSVEDILDKEENARIVSKLHEILRPFLLRRLKKDVLKDLVPPKREIVVYCGMSSLQQDFYTLCQKKKLRQALIDIGIEGAHQMSDGTGPGGMALRRICQHPFLLGEPRDPETRMPIGVKNPKLLVNASGKLRLLDRILERLHARRNIDGSRQQVLIFSQFTTMMDILEDYLTFKNWGYCRIDGSCQLQDRQDHIDDFVSKDTDKFAFLLSTRAGGLGINLASASAVVLFDSDWNPQMDSQAQDRAHRIGQKNPVTVYRLLTVGSIEIGMMERAVSKKKLERMAIGGGDYRRAGRRSRGQLTLEALKKLLEDDVASLDKRGADESGQENFDEIDAEELDAITDPQRIFAGDNWTGVRGGEPLPKQGAMYDVVEADAENILNAMC